MAIPEILIVESLSASIECCREALGMQFRLTVASTGEAALELLTERGRFALILAGMRLPGMTGAHLLAEARKHDPDAVRILLAASADLTEAMEAVNESNLFRLLAQPCEPEALCTAAAAGLAQYRLIQSEKHLLEKTLMGSIHVLHDVLSAASPEAFARSMRISRLVEHMARKFHVRAPWQFQVAATLSQLGCVTLDADLVSSAYSGDTLTAEEQVRFDSHPQRAMELLGEIPRLEPVAWIVGQQLLAEIPPFVSADPSVCCDEIHLGARMLKLAVAYEDLRVRLSSEEYVKVRLSSRVSEFSEELLRTLADLAPAQPLKDLRRVATARLKAGMILNQEIRNRQGLLVIGKGQQVTLSMLFKLENFARTGTIDHYVMAFVDA